MDLKQFKRIAPAIDKEVEAVFAKYGMKVGKRSATINALEGTVSFRLTLVDANLKDASGNATTPEALRFSQNAQYMGMKAEWLGQTFAVGSKTYKVVGLRAGRTSKPVLVEIDGQPNYILSVDSVRRGFGLPAERSLAELRAAAYAGQP